VLLIMKKILIVDDDQLVVKTVQKLLTKQGYEVKTATNAIEAISLVARHDFDLVISDIRMPGESGIIAVQKIQEIYKEKRIDCGYIFFSGYAEEDTPAHAVQLGVDKFIYKPFDSELFLKNVEEELLLTQRKREGDKRPERIHKLRRPARETVKAQIRRAVITGIGCVAPNGIGKEAYWKALREGKNSIDRITFFDPAKYPSQMAAEIRDFNPTDFIEDEHEAKRMARSSQLAIAAAKLALKDSNLSLNGTTDLSVIIGSATSGVEYLLPEAYAFERGGLSKVHPYVGIAGFVGSISSEVSRFLQARGLSHTISTGCTSSFDAMGYALRQIQYGFSDLVLTGGADACVCDGILAAFCRMGAVSSRNHEPTRASRPFNKDRDGFVIAEGSWMFILEELEHALKRKATIYGELLGYGATCDAWHMSRPYPSGEYSVEAIRLALEDGGIQPEEVDIFESYGNATIINDSYETGVVKKVFGKHAYKLVMPSVKSMIGHAIGAAGAGQLAAALMALNEGFVHPTINYEVPDPECDLDYASNKGKEGKFHVAVCNSLAFGGKNASIAIRTVSDEL